MKENELKEKLEEIFYQNYEQIDEYITFFLLIKKLGKSYVKRIYSEDSFNKKIKTLESLNAFKDYEKEIYSSIENLNNFNLPNIEWIRYFVILAETENFEVAAHKLNISSRALQKAIIGTENLLKVELINGKSTFKGLTYAGKFFLESAREIIQNLFDLNRSVASLNRETNIVHLNIGWVNFFSINILLDAISNLKNNFPDVYIKTHFIGEENTEKWVENGEIDLGLILNKPLLKSTEYFECKKTPYVIVGKPQEKKDWKDLKYFTFPKKNQQDYDCFHEIFESRIISEVEYDLIFHLCEEGVGSVFLPLSNVIEKIETGSLAIIADSPEEHFETPYIIWNKNISMNNVVSTFIEEIKEKI